MRVLRIGTVVMGVTGEVERAWEELERTAREHAKVRGDGAPLIRFRTDTGISGSLPVREDVPVVFGDAEPPEAGRFGTIIAADGGSTIPAGLATPEQVNDEWRRMTEAWFGRPPSESL